jgi:peptidoglycan/xylan/chitin deacetylase (PgdA/CDA1 family)
MLSALLTAGVAGTIGGSLYAGLSPQSQIFGETIIAGRNPNAFALTYDDGPNDPVTPRLLELLARHDVRATFFLIGKFVRQRPEIARLIAGAGHLIGNHTMTHPWLVLASPARVRREIADCSAAIEDAIGDQVKYFRCPHGARRPDVLRSIREMGMVPVQWNVTAYDWEPISAEKIFANIEQGIARNIKHGRGSNILLHDGGQNSIGQDRMASVRATEMLLAKYAATKKFVTPEAWT